MNSPGMVVRPFSDLTVLECGSGVIAPYCAKLILGLGARVIKVEEPHTGDESRRRGPYWNDEPTADGSGLFQYLNAGKEGITLDLSSSQGNAILRRLAAICDVVVADKPLAEAQTMGLDWATLKEINPSLVLLTITPFGLDGPMSSWKATDLTLYHMAGLAYATPGLVENPETDAPLRGGSYQASFASGLGAAINLSAALLLKLPESRASEGFQIDFSSYEALVSILGQNIASYSFHGAGLNRDIARGSGAGGLASTRNVRCKDGYVQIHLSGARQWEMFRELLGDPEWMNDERISSPATRRRNWPFLKENLESWTAQYTRHELFFLLQGRKIACGPVSNGGDLLADQGLEDRNFWVSPLGASEWMFPKGPFLLSAVDWTELGAAPALGEHNSQVLCGDLHLTGQELLELQGAGVI